MKERGFSADIRMWEIPFAINSSRAMNRIPLIPCTTCNYCAKVCPQHIKIREELEHVAEVLL